MLKKYLLQKNRRIKLVTETEKTELKSKTVLPELSDKAIGRIKEIYEKARRVNNVRMKNIMDMVFKEPYDYEISDELKVNKCTMYRYVSKYMVDNETGIWIKSRNRNERGKGKNNWNKWDAEIQNIVDCFDKNLSVAKACKEVKISYPTLMKYLFRLLFLMNKEIFAKI
jgi:hypothetical protein